MNSKLVCVILDILFEATVRYQIMWIMCELMKQSLSAMDEILNYLYTDVHTRLKPNVPLGLDDALQVQHCLLHWEKQFLRRDDLSIR